MERHLGGLLLDSASKNADGVSAAAERSWLEHRTCQMRVEILSADVGLEVPPPWTHSSEG